WGKGLLVDSILAWYDSTGHNDWLHKETSAGVLKAQHPELELYNQGIHARSGLACADCHMPYNSTGAMKVSHHHVRSPLLNINRACQTCHRWSEEELLARAHTIQSRNFELRNTAMDALVSLIDDIRTVRTADSNDPRLASARVAQRRAQFFLDFVE